MRYKALFAALVSIVVLLFPEVSAAQTQVADKKKAVIQIFLAHSDFVTGRAEEEPLHKGAYQELTNLRNKLLDESERENIEVSMYSQFAGDESFGGFGDSDVSVSIMLARAKRTNQISCVSVVSYRYAQTGQKTFVARKNCFGKSIPAGWSLGYPTYQEVMKAVQLWRASL